MGVSHRRYVGLLLPCPHVTTPFLYHLLQVVPCSQQRTMMEVIRTGMKHRKVGEGILHNGSCCSHLARCAEAEAQVHNGQVGPALMGCTVGVSTAGWQPPAEHGVQQITCHLHCLL